MFKRRRRLTVLDRAREFFWPKMGWLRSATYVVNRVKRFPGTPHAIAAGFACGVAVSFTPFIGLHFVLAALLAWIIGGSLMASAIGTVIGNPWTFPLIWVGVYRVGCAILGWDPGHALPAQLSIAYIFEHPGAILLPMSVGALPAGAVAWLLAYVVVREVVADYQKLRRRRRAKRLAARRETARARRGLAAGKEGAP